MATWFGRATIAGVKQNGAGRRIHMGIFFLIGLGKKSVIFNTV
jgi:hypothetical protein